MGLNEIITKFFMWRFKLKHIRVSFWQLVGTGWWQVKSAWIPLEAKKVNYNKMRYNIEPECYLFRQRKWGFHLYPEINFKVGDSKPLTWQKGEREIPAEIYGVAIRNDIFKNFLKAQGTKSYMLMIMILAIGLCISLFINFYLIQGLGTPMIPQPPP